MDIPDSPRLSYHFVTAQDADFLYQVDQDEAVMEFINGGKKTSQEEIHDIYLPRLAAYADPARGWGIWRVVLNDTFQQDIGWILSRPMGFFTTQRDDSNIELGWRFKQLAWGHGYATEAARQVMQTIQSTNNIQRFSAIALEGNLASIAIMKKLGMTFSHTHLYQDDLFDEEVVVYSTSPDSSKA